MSQPKTVKTFESVIANMKKSASARKAEATKSAGGPEATDPADKGTVAIPKDPDAVPAKQNVPEQSTNADTTPVLEPPAAKEVPNVETPDVTKRAAAAAAKIKNLTAQLKTAATTGKQGDPVSTKHDATSPTPVKGTQVAPNLPPSEKNDGSKGAADMKSAAPVDTAKDPADKGNAAEPKVDSKGALPPETKNEDKPMEAQKLAAATGQEQFNEADLIKVARLMLSSEEGRQQVLVAAQRQHGAEIGADMVKAAAMSEQLLSELEQANMAGAIEAEEMWKNASEDDRNKMIKLAETHRDARAKLQTEDERKAYDIGAFKAASMADAGLMGDQVPEGAEDPNSISDEDILAVIDQLVQSGQITPEVAQQLLAALQGGGAGGAAPAADPAAMAAPAASMAVPAAPVGGAPVPAAEPKAEPKAEGGEKKDDGDKDDKKSAAAPASLADAVFASLDAAA